MALIKKVGTQKQDGAPESGDTNTFGTGAPGTRRVSTPAMQSGVVLQDRYLIEGTLGIGGMSIVYRGRDLRFKDVVRPCAIKEMAQSAPDSNTRLLNLKNFERESGLLATLQHPAIPKVYDFFEENGRVYLILELISGKDLETVLDEAGGPLPEERVARWGVQICDVLIYLHNHEPEPIVFRDMKPSNIMVTEQDRIVLIDFGIARNLTRPDRKGTMIGTEGYSPPEQYRGLAEPRGDLYALGATLHHLLTASDPRLETPFTFHERPLRQLNPAVSPELDAVVARALEYDMTARWASSEELKDALLSTPTLTSQAPATGARPMTPAMRERAASTELIWSFKCEDEVRSSPCVSNGMMYVGCYDTNLYALDAGRGEFRWKHATEGGISSSPMVWQDLVIVGSEDGALYALDTRRGNVRWTFRTGKPIR
ncbi:MAG: protein kinase domain-containing protein, partial [Roseiflexaceae bacterium]